MRYLNFFKSFSGAILLIVVVASIFPVQGITLDLLKQLTNFFIALLFFMHGAKLSSAAIFEGGRHWRLHLLVLSTTFILFPIIGIILICWQPLPMPQVLYQGFLYLCLLPSTVQSSIIFTSLARGNVAAAVCATSASSIIGIFITPILVKLFMHVHNPDLSSLEQVWHILLLLFFPFIIGHLSRIWTKNWIDKHRKWIKITDQSSILLVVFTAFSEAINHGIWLELDYKSLIYTIILSVIILVIALLFTSHMAKLLGFNFPDQITTTFCGSKKSLANGVPMASILFPAASAGILVIPLMIFHQVQLMVCAVLARRYRLETNKSILDSSKQ